MSEISYYFLWIVALIELFGSGFLLASVGRPRENVTSGVAIASTIMSIGMVIACWYMQKPGL